MMVIFSRCLASFFGVSNFRDDSMGGGGNAGDMWLLGEFKNQVAQRGHT